MTAFRTFLFSIATCIPMLVGSHQDPETVFSEIYYQKMWAINQEGKGTSGCGSTLKATKDYREFLQAFLEANQIKTVVDAGCGDWEFSKAIDWTDIHYTGFDIVKFLVKENIRKYGSEYITFIHDDITTADLPAADLLICKDVLQHWPTDTIIQFLKQLSKFKYCLITSDVDRKTASSTNPNIPLGEFRDLDLTKPPFSVDAIKIFTYNSDQVLKQVLLITSEPYSHPYANGFTKPAKHKPSAFCPCDFEESIRRHGLSDSIYEYYTNKKYFTKYFVKIRKNMSIFQNLFNNLDDYLTDNNQTHKIPKIIHQIWLGGTLPIKYHELVQTWANWHGWEYKLWTDHEVSKLHLRNQFLFDKVKNYGEKADILRLELLYAQGGLYVDTDFECLNPHFFDLMHDSLDFYAGIEPLEHGGLKICNAIMAAAPQHPLINACIEGLENSFRQNRKKSAFERGGPNYITEVISNYIDKPTKMRDVFFPTSYLYPSTMPDIGSGDVYIFPESAAQHYWSGSWK